MTKRQAPRTYLAKLSTLAARWNTERHLSGISLAHILAGDTCAPISLSDFEAYLAFKEYSLENLHFVVWFQDYRKRFFQLPVEDQIYSPGPNASSFAFAVPSYAEVERRAHACSSPTSSKSPHDRASLVTTMEKVSISPTRSAFMPLLSRTRQSESGSPLASSFLPKLPESIVYERQPMRSECMRAISTFLRAGAPKELSLDEILRDTIIRNLATNTHPDIFLPAYEEIYNTLERISLPRFLAFSTTNINWPKQLFWYFLGVLHLLGSITIAVTIICLVSDKPLSRRAWRVFALPYAWFASMQLFAAFRGFCNQVWNRNGVQLHAWEMHQDDEESKTFVDRSPIDKIPSSDVAVRPSSRPQGVESNDDHHDVPHAISISIPTSPSHSDGDSTLNTAATATIIAPFLFDDSKDFSPPSSSENSFSRPPIFGPERVVMDPRIKAVHQQIMNSITIVGAVYVILFSAIIFSVPSRAR